MSRLAMAFTVLASLSGALVVRANVVGRVDGVVVATVASGQPMTINLGAVGANEYRLVRIYDPTLDGSGLPDEDVGAVTVTGTADPTAQIDIAIIWRSTAFEPTFPSDATTTINDIGVRNFGGLTMSSASLRSRTRVAIAAVNEISGTITVGQVFRVQAGILAEGVPASGVISADITATQPQTIWRLHYPPNDAVGECISVVTCNDLISGRIEALTDGFVNSDQSTWGKIESIVVGPSVDARGIQNSILATTGSIGSITTTGPVGSASLSPSIHASGGITELRVMRDTSGELLDRDLHVDSTRACPIRRQGSRGQTPPSS